MYSGSPLKTANRAGFVGLIAIVASFVAHAEVQEPAPTAPEPVATEPAPTPEPTPPPPPETLVPAPNRQQAAPAGAPVAVTAAKVEAKKSKRAFRGSAISYGHQATAYTFDRAAQAYYNPTWSHSLALAPMWNFTDLLFARARLTISQEFTISDSTTRRNEVELSDLTLDVGASGIEPVTKIRIGGDFRVGFPTSKASRYATRLLSIGPGLNASRSFPVLAGLIVGYSGRYSYRFHSFTTPRFESSPLFACADRNDRDCLVLSHGGRRNAHSDVTHGPSLSFSPISSVTLAGSAQFTTQFLYRLSPSAEPLLDEARDVPFRYFTNFDLSVSWQIFKPVGITLGASTLSLQLNSEGKRQFPLFDRNTTLYLDVSFDIEAAASGLFGEST
jgi:hypothetical protein